MEIRECKLEVIGRQIVKTFDIPTRLREEVPVWVGLDEQAAIKEAQRCLGTHRCDGCGICLTFCPDSCIALKKPNGIEINYDTCKGCGICAAICPKGAIEMMFEEVEL
jgi:2-oxoacid:acceptor oxidoreductase delta subunit (pyruvate/2-ketoisovalerate family)